MWETCHSSGEHSRPKGYVLQEMVIPCIIPAEWQMQKRKAERIFSRLSRICRGGICPEKALSIDSVAFALSSSRKPHEN